MNESKLWACFWSCGLFCLVKHVYCRFSVTANPILVCVILTVTNYADYHLTYEEAKIWLCGQVGGEILELWSCSGAPQLIKKRG